MSIKARQRFPQLVAATLAILTLSLPGAAALADAARHPLPLWRVGDGDGHRMYLVGSMHALTPEDYPLPAAFADAFDRSQRLVEELDLGKITPARVRNAIKSFALLPADKTLAEVLGDERERVHKLADKAGIDLALYQRFKPWYAAIRIVAHSFVAAGFRPDLGLDRHFAQLAAQRGMPIIGLETLTEQLGFFSDLAPTLQKQFLIQTLKEAPRDKRELAALREAWRTGNTGKLAAIADQDFDAFPKLRKQLLAERNRRWLPVLERCLADARGCLVVVGAEHMAGPDGLLALLGDAGYQVKQLHGSQAPVTAGTTAGTTGG